MSAVFLIITGSPGFWAREAVDYWEWNFDARLGLPNAAGMRTYSDGGLTHPNDPQGIKAVIVKIRPDIEPHLTAEERASLKTYEELEAAGWFSWSL